ncbi:somatostatin-2 [Protopterus annectens]|uniref:somatostatin-2 n=1 Tax=Protopterus annectens TaxID=7888 RepID=UPI001CFB7F07|nr:somatostatin-2 [Protopterus annectens]
MQFLASLVSFLLVVWSVKATALPVEDRLSVHSNRDLTRERKEMILKMISGLLDGSDNSLFGGEVTSMDIEEPLENKLEERAAYNRLPQLPQRDRKAPCKNFFWKTFTSC